MTAAEKIQKAKIDLLLNPKHAFYSTLLLGFEYAECKEIETADIDGKTMRYNPDFINEICPGKDYSELIFLLCHETLHVAYFHHTRRGNRDISEWNEACDFAINQILVDAGFKMPKGGLLDKKYRSLSAEQIFAARAKDKQQQQGSKPNPQGQEQPNNDPGRTGGVKDSPGKTAPEKAAEEAQTQQQIINAVNIAAKQYAKHAGEVPEYMRKMVDAILTPVINWRQKLSRFLYETAREDYSFTKPNTRYLHTGFYLPSLHNHTPGKLVIFVDISGSIFAYMQAVNQFNAEAQAIADELRTPLLLVYINTEVTGTQTFEPGEPVKMEFEGGGGTRFVPAFQYLIENEIECKAIIYLTDGDCYEDLTKHEPDQPVIWAKYGNCQFTPPFGEVIQIDTEDQD